MATMNTKTGRFTFTDQEKTAAAQPVLCAALQRCLAALAANGAANCEAATEARAALAKYPAAALTYESYRRALGL